MAGYISSLDDRFLSFERIAKLLILERPDLKKKQVLDSLKHALFAGDFESSENTPETDGMDLNQLRILHPQPLAEISNDEFVPTARPCKYYGVDRYQVALILYHKEGLPEPLDDWERFFGPAADPFHRPLMYRHLSNIPIKSYPKSGQKILGKIFISKSRLRDWMLLKGFALPSFLNSFPTASDNPEDAAAPGKGRPRNPRWDDIKDLVQQVADSNPDMLHKNIAHRVHKTVRQKYPHEKIPAENTILRKVGTLLKD
ncbi:hypothetical protein [Emcibacter nanhaiensis]|uniref:Uncharacterized protein n=1 Tax=Emcibacter nanhaiensis TaxID=1505037 RepID=A0A501PG62_9PROT|nr:hypothetical protein [Emcibacter nanhaiensis]TPD58992.1 hypothetical protein FIV46_12205 [Emcibacter nanhaiensis]